MLYCILIHPYFALAGGGSGYLNDAYGEQLMRLTNDKQQMLLKALIGQEVSNWPFVHCITQCFFTCTWCL